MPNLVRTEPFTIVYHQGPVHYIQGDRKFNCGGYEIVGGIAQTPEYLASQKETPDEHDTEEGFRCEQCDKAYKTKAALAAHNTKVHKEA